MGIIRIENLKVFGYHGVYEEEKTSGQFFLINLDFYLSLQKAGMTDELDNTLDYAFLCEEIETIFKENRFNLLEACADFLAKHFLFKYQKIEEIMIEIKKEKAPLRQNVGFVELVIKRKRHLAYLGLGSNLGDKEKNFKKAIKEIEKTAKVEKISSFIVTEPIGYINQDKFLNAVIKIQTHLEVKELLIFLKGIETKLKREKKIPFGPRTIDLDILFYDDLIFKDETLEIPHYAIPERLFVLKPLCEIAPEIVHPVIGKTIWEMKNSLENNGGFITMRTKRSYLYDIIYKFSQSSWDLIAISSREFLKATDKKKVFDKFIESIKEAEKLCGNCGCEFDILYKEILHNKELLWHA